ncbi:hypothetical protein Q5Y75_05780 [Ruegeria sp. 2205SS24-7]|uniref:hypothetical protein n=1 Tax=Ruegeria discodermiae TaxID=3064389 RepID=UPI002740723F|nr:hypothetical protein [Ruegeria sp. 2205SS24-7]MDP5216721.1 hypothetical protein [Ruegeria sp. 2205SS24-7]
MPFDRHHTRPDWTICDRKVDMSDVWIEEMDPEGERGEEVTAFMDSADLIASNDRHEDVHVTGMKLVGICISDGSTPVYRDREWCVNKLGVDVVWRVEEYEMEA